MANSYITYRNYVPSFNGNINVINVSGKKMHDFYLKLLTILKTLILLPLSSNETDKAKSSCN